MNYLSYSWHNPAHSCWFMKCWYLVSRCFQISAVAQPPPQIGKIQNLSLFFTTDTVFSAQFLMWCWTQVIEWWQTEFPSTKVSILVDSLYSCQHMSYLENTFFVVFNLCSHNVCNSIMLLDWTLHNGTCECDWLVIIMMWLICWWLCKLRLSSWPSEPTIIWLICGWAQGFKLAHSTLPDIVMPV